MNISSIKTNFTKELPSFSETKEGSFNKTNSNIDSEETKQKVYASNVCFKNSTSLTKMIGEYKSRINPHTKQAINSFLQIDAPKESMDSLLKYILNNEELSKRLKEYKLYKKQEIPSIVPLFIFVPIVFILLSIFLICFLKDKNNFDLYFFSLLLPALMIFVVVSIYSIYRMYKINNFINKGEAIQKEILNNAKKR